MKKISAALLVLAILVSMTTAFANHAGTASDPLLTRSYLESTVKPKLNSIAEKIIRSYELDESYEMKLDEIVNNATNRIIPAGYSFSSGYQLIDAPAGSKITTLTGGSLILISGEMTLEVQEGQVINIMTASSASGTIAANVRYFAAESTVAVYTAASDAVCMVEGIYKPNGASLFNASHFNDINTSDKDYEAILAVCENGIMSVVSDKCFEPETDITIEALIDSLWKLSGKSGTSGKEWAKANNIWTYSDNEATVTHEELAVILYRYAQKYSLNTGVSINLKKYDDNALVTPEYRTAVAWAIENGIISGSISSVIEPKDHTTRRQAAIALFELMNY